METMEMEIEIQDNFTGILYSVMDSVSMTAAAIDGMGGSRSEEHTSELQSQR